jgi:hypothetical protein
LATSSRGASAPLEAERVERERLLPVDRLLLLADRLLEPRPRPPLELRLLPDELRLLELRLLLELLRPLELLRLLELLPLPELRVVRRPPLEVDLLPDPDPPEPPRLACAMVPPSMD